MTKFSERLKELREEKNLTQEELGKAINTNIITISRWERGVRTPNINSLETLANFFKVTAGYLIGLED